jgi:hypothetical protein
MRSRPMRLHLNWLLLLPRQLMMLRLLLPR